MPRRNKRNLKHLPKELLVGTEVMIENTAQKERKGGSSKSYSGALISLLRSWGGGYISLEISKALFFKRNLISKD